MKAVVFAKTDDLQVIEIEKPIPQPDQVLIKVAYCGICATDYDNFRGFTSFAKNGGLRYPLRFGHEWSGVVCEVGSAVTELKVGDKVVGDGKVTCNECENCKNGKWYDCTNIRSVGTVHDHWPGAMAEYLLMPARNVFKIGDHVSLKAAAMCEPVNIAMNGFRECSIEGKTVLVIGSGPIAMGGIAAAKVLGAKKIICAGRKAFKLQKALEMGATDIIDLTKGTLYEQIRPLNDGNLVDFALETTGCTDFVENIMDIVASMGTMSMVGFYERPLNNFDLDKIIFGKITLRGASGARQIAPFVAELISEGKIDLMPLMTHKLDFYKDAERMMDFYASVPAERLKVLVEIGGEDVGSTI